MANVAGAKLTSIPVPTPCYLDRCTYIGTRNGEKRWISGDRSKLYTWDWTHGEIEVFNRRGGHLGVLDAITGALIKNAVAGRKIDV